MTGGSSRICLPLNLYRFAFDYNCTALNDCGYCVAPQSFQYIRIGMVVCAMRSQSRPSETEILALSQMLQRVSRQPIESLQLRSYMCVCVCVCVCVCNLCIEFEHAQEWSGPPLPGPQTFRIHIPLPYRELGLPNIDPSNDKGSY